MAICPFAVWKPLPENKTEPFITATQVVYHTAVDQPGPTSLYPFFARDDVTVETHFFIKWDGTIEQYIDTARQADGQRYGNIRAISIETEDDGTPVTNPWTDEQMASLVRLTKWLMKEHPGIAPRICRHWEDPGIGWHAMWGAPSQWTPSRGKTCPGSTRIAQIPAVVDAVLNDKTPPTNDKEEEMLSILGLKEGDGMGDDDKFLKERVMELQRVVNQVLSFRGVELLVRDGDYWKKTSEAVGHALHGEPDRPVKRINDWASELLLDRYVVARSTAVVRSALKGLSLDGVDLAELDKRYLKPGDEVTLG